MRISNSQHSHLFPFFIFIAFILYIIWYFDALYIQYVCTTYSTEVLLIMIFSHLLPHTFFIYDIYHIDIFLLIYFRNYTL